MNPDVSDSVTILGCGPSTGVPRFGGHWGACDPLDPRNRRSRSSIAVNSNGATLVVDASPDFRAQALSVGLDRVDALLITHAHSDHIGGLDEFRAVGWGSGGPVPVYAERHVMDEMRVRFSYAFLPSESETYPAFLDPREIAPQEPFSIRGQGCTAFSLPHGNVWSTGFRIGDFAYTTDLSDLPEEALGALRGLRTWVVGCLGRHPHPTHAHLEVVLQWVEELRPDRTVLTHLGLGFDYATLRSELPDTVEPAFDGMVLADPF